MAQSYTQKVENTSEQAGRLAGYSEQATESSKQYASEAADRVAAVAKDAFDDPHRFAEQTKADLTRYTKDNPLQALAIAAGVAFVVGALWKR